MQNVLFFLLFFVASGFTEASQVFNSGERQVQLIELYTSEGCSSCPPADRWMSSLLQQEGLWKRFVPVAFHVDYWNYLGWKDPFSSSRYSNRQRAYQRSGNIYSVYTPGFVVDGQEWRAWFSNRTLPPRINELPGNLSLQIKENKYSTHFQTKDLKKTRIFNIALLGIGLATDVPRGENAGRRLNHDFVVLWLHSEKSKAPTWSGNIPSTKHSNLAIAAWVSDDKTNRPIQAVGGILE